MKNLVKRFLKNESGATAIEYALIAGALSVAIVAGMTLLGDGLSTRFGNIKTELNKSVSSGTTGGTTSPTQ